MSQKVIVALDGIDEARALELATELSGSVWGFKVNSLLLQCGVSIVTKLKEYGKVFADPKLYDIPNTVKNSVELIAGAGADLITIHASGGAAMIDAAVKASGSCQILTVTALTSLQSTDTLQVYGRSAGNTVITLARIATRAGANGIVCSAKELSMLNSPEFSCLTKVVPGIRPANYNKSDDQSRVATPKQAVTNGASLLVIGRPIVGAASPREAAEAISSELLS